MGAGGGCETQVGGWAGGGAGRGRFGAALQYCVICAFVWSGSRLSHFYCPAGVVGSGVVAPASVRSSYGIDRLSPVGCAQRSGLVGFCCSESDPVTATCLLCTGVSAILVTDDSGRAQAAAGTVAAAAAVGDDCSRAGVCTAAHSASLPAGGADTAVCAGSVWLVICC